MITCTGGPESILEVLSGQTTSIEMLFDCGQPVQGISRSSYIVDSTRRWLPIRWELQSNISDVKINGSQIRLGVQLKAKMGSFGYYEMLAMLFSEEDDNTDYYARFNVSVVPEKGVGEAKFDDGLWSQWFYNPVSGDRTFNFNASAASAPDRLLSKPMNLKLACQDILLTDRFGATIPDTHCRWLQSRFTQKSFYNGTHHVTTGTITLKPEDVAPGSPLDQINPCFALTDDFHEYEYSPQWNIGGDSRSDSKFVNLDAEEHLTPGGVMVVNLDAENIKDSRSVLPVPLVMSIKCGDSYLVNDKGEKIIDDHCEWINSTVRVLPDTGGKRTYVLYENAFGPQECKTFTAGCYSCPGDSCAESSKENDTTRFQDGSTLTFFPHTASLAVKLPNGTTVNVSDYRLGVVKQYTPDYIPPVPVLSLKKTPDFSRGLYSFIHQLVRGLDGAIRRLAFSITYPRTSADIGHLTVGGDPDPSWHSPFVTLHQRDDQGWILNLDEAGYRSGAESEALHIEKARVLFDSGSSGIWGPVKEVKRLLEYISKFVHIDGARRMNCSNISKLPELWFDIKADDEEGLTTRLFIEGKDYIKALKLPGICRLRIEGMDYPPTFGWIIGDPLFKGHFVQYTYDIGSIGFAKKKI
ncbi:hypothetical protein FOL47_007237 [Perkinsus chesapeaki]|uniref:Peptidase A1 domain-containing protein n=1 Tax=Perkinsus chesapeaki TaxID=330153 RepID=A0A7J6MY52_PERCH|nr:hypothetical protein FOL47_007237 [Perkinsus chesapeaki]